MDKTKKTIGMIIYANPSYYPPLVNSISLLAKEFNILIISRNMDAPLLKYYPPNVTLLRLGRYQSSREKESQHVVAKFLEYVAFVIRSIYYVRLYRCFLVYSLDAHGYVPGFFASIFGRRLPLVYQNFDMIEPKSVLGLSYLIKHLELRLARYADKVVFPNRNRALCFQKEAHLAAFPEIVMHTPLRLEQSPPDLLAKFLREIGFQDYVKVVLYQGSINHERLPMEVIDSIVSWPENALLVLIGYVYGGYLDEIYRRTRLNHTNNRVIHFPHMIPFSEITLYTVGGYLGLAIFKQGNINMKYMAGASNKIFEYMSVGIPAVVSDCEDMRALLDPSWAYFVSADSADDIGRVIRSALLNEEEHARKREACRQAHLTKFYYELQYEPVYKFVRNNLGIGSLR